jgi:acyl transferase domain-containing protein
LTPHPVLSNAIQENLEFVKKRNTTIASLWREKDELVSFYSAFGQYFESGIEVDWTKIYPEVQKFVLLPNYQWQKERFWFDQKPNLSHQTIEATEEILTPSAVIEEAPTSKDVIFETVWKEVEVVSLINYLNP